MGAPDCYWQTSQRRTPGRLVTPPRGDGRLGRRTSMSQQSQHRAAKVYRIAAKPEVYKEMRRPGMNPAASFGLGPEHGARVAPLRCPILRLG